MCELQHTHTHTHTEDRTRQVDHFSLSVFLLALPLRLPQRPQLIFLSPCHSVRCNYSLSLAPLSLSDSSLLLQWFHLSLSVDTYHLFLLSHRCCLSPQLFPSSLPSSIPHCFPTYLPRFNLPYLSFKHSVHCFCNMFFHNSLSISLSPFLVLSLTPTLSLSHHFHSLSLHLSLPFSPSLFLPLSPSFSSLSLSLSLPLTPFLSLLLSPPF